MGRRHAQRRRGDRELRRHLARHLRQVRLRQLHGLERCPQPVLRFTTGAYFRPYKDETSELKLGINGTYLSYNQNLSFYTVGQGGYFSPQSFYSLTFPIDWTETSGRFKYNAGGAIGVQTIQQDASPYFPNNWYLQNAANNLATTNGTLPPVYPSTSNTGIAFALRLGFEYAMTDRTAIGAKANFDNSYQYDQGTILLFLRSAIN